MGNRSPCDVLNSNLSIRGYLGGCPISPVLVKENVTSKKRKIVMRIAKLFKTGIVACTLGLVLCSALFAADLDPVAALVFSGYDNLDSGIEKVLDTAGYKEFHTVLTMMTDGIDGIDKSKPAGVVLLGNETDLLPVVFLPVADFDALTCPGIEVLKEKFSYDAEKKTINLKGNEEGDDSSDGECCLIEENDWLFVVPAQNVDLLSLQGAPESWIEEIPSKYLVGGFFHVDRVPAEIIDSLFSALRVSASKDDNLADGLESLGKMADFTKANIKVVEFGLSIDSSKGDLVLSSTVTPVPDSSFAKSLKANEKPVTLWSDFFDPSNSVLAVSKSQIVESEMVEFQKNQWNSMMSKLISSISSDDEEDASDIQNLLEEWKDWGDKIYDTGKSDGAFSFEIDGTLVSACSIVEGKETQTLIEKTFEQVKNLIDAGKDNGPDVKKFLDSFKVNPSQYKGFTVTTFIVPVSGIDKSFSFLIGTRDDAMIVIAGPSKKVVSDLFKEKAAIEYTEKAAPQKWVFSIPNLAKFAQTFDEISEDENFGKVVSTLAEGSSDAVITGEFECTPEAYHQSVTITGELIKLLCDTAESFLSDETDDNAEDESENDAH